MVLGLKISGALSLFLNDMRFSNDTPELLDYLKRLFQGEPCGSFPDSFNDLDNHIDYQQARAALSVMEGPRVCSDGVTPVVELWPA